MNRRFEKMLVSIGCAVAAALSALLNTTTPAHAKKYFSIAIVSGLLWIVNIPVASAMTQNQVQELLASDGAEGDFFGISVAVNGDTAVVGAHLDENGTGAVYVFVRSGEVWTQQAKLTASDAAIGDSFGQSISMDGDTVVIGAHSNNAAAFASGAAYVFVRSGGVWTQQAKLTASSATFLEQFGYSVAVNGDTAVIGAQDELGSFTGSAYVFVRSGGVWTQQAKLTASDAAAQDNFGYSAAVNGDTAVIGALRDEESTGSAYVFVRSGGVWTQQAKLTASDAAEDDQFSISIAVSGDTALIGGYANDDAGSASGSVYVFVRTGGVWTEQIKLTASDAEATDRFGISVALNGNMAVIGAYGDEGPTGSATGSAYVFVRTGGIWTEQIKLTASDRAEGDRFGISVSVDGNSAVIGAILGGDVGIASGSAYVFDLISDSDDDGVSDDQDNCPSDFNTDQADNDNDGIGDVCDDDDDNDTVLDLNDNCPIDVNTDQADNDNDGVGDVCDDDDDNDSVLDNADLCPLTPNDELVGADGCTVAQKLEDLSGAIQDLIDGGVSNKAQYKLEKAQKKLDKAMSEFAEGDVKKSIKEIGKAAKELLKAADEGVDVVDLIDRMVDCTRAQAQASIDASINLGGDQHDIDKALEEMEKAQEDLDDNKPDNAIDHYSKAWYHADKA